MFFCMWLSNCPEYLFVEEFILSPSFHPLSVETIESFMMEI